MQPSADLPPSADVVIIGGGIVGAATAFFAARAGLRPVIVEARPALCSLTTPASTGAFRAQFDNAEEMALVCEGITLFEHFAEVADLPGYSIDLQRQGYLWLTTRPDYMAHQQRQVRRQQEWGLKDVEWLSGDEARYRFPYLAPEIVGARYRAGDGWLDVRKLTMGYVQASRATVCLNTAVTGFDAVGGRVQGVVTAHGTIATERAVIAAGPFAAQVADWAGVAVPLAPVARQKLIMPDVPEVPPDAPMTIDEDSGAHWRPALQGAYLLRTVPGLPAGPPLADVPTRTDLVFDLLDPSSPYSVARISPFWRAVWARNTSAWAVQAGQYAYTPDHRPFLGATPVVGLYLNCGYSGHGIMASAGGSRLTVDALIGTLPAAANPFRLDRPMATREFDVL